MMPFAASKEPCKNEVKLIAKLHADDEEVAYIVHLRVSSRLGRD